MEFKFEISYHNHIIFTLIIKYLLCFDAEYRVMKGKIPSSISY